MRRRLVLFFAFIFLGLPLVGCDLFQSSPKEVVERYFSALEAGHPEKAWELISADDRAVKDKGDFISGQENDKALATLIKTYTHSKVTKQVINGDNATVTVETTLPDLSAILGEVISNALASLGTEKPEGGPDEADRIAEKAKAQAEAGTLKMTTVSNEIDLVKEDGEWKIFFHWREQQEKEAREASIKNLLGQAGKAVKARKLEEAETLYAQVQSLDPGNSELESGRAELARAKEKLAYFDKVVVYDFKARYMDSMLDGRVPGVSFKIRNKGNRTLNRVEVTVYFKDKDGNTISEEDYNPVLVTDYNFMGDNKPLKPGYIWRMERGHFYSAKSVPDEWKEGAAEIKVTDLEFADDK